MESIVANLQAMRVLRHDRLGFQREGGSKMEKDNYLQQNIMNLTAMVILSK